MAPSGSAARRGPGASEDAREDSFAAFFHAHCEGVSRLIQRIVESRPEAEDLVQEAFLRTYLRGPRGAEGEYRKAWLYRVAVNLAVNALRGRKRRTSRESGAVLEERVGPYPEPTPEEVLHRRERARLVRQVLERLPDRTARILSLRYGGLSYAEIAEALEIAPNSVGTLLARAERSFEEIYRPLAAVRPQGDRS